MVEQEEIDKYISPEIKMRSREKDRFVKQAKKLRMNLTLREKQIKERRDQEESKDGDK